jgi:predicted MFS family arabinose efflux permease
MTSLERKATFSLAAIYALRMLGLFMILPVLSLFAEQLEGSTPLLIGLAISIYGLTQALLQIPFGLMSDRFGRKKIIIIGLILFASGSIIAAVSNTIYGILFGRALQGSGAIAAAIMALVADLTQEAHRTKAMATIGVSIGVSFAIAITLGPIVAGYVGIQGIFWLTAGLAILAILVVAFVVPNPQQSKIHPDAELIPAQFGEVLKNLDLLRLDYGIFILHLILTASFVIVPLLIRDAGLLPEQHWQIYLPVLFVSFITIIPFIILAEKKRKMKGVFMSAIATLVIANLGLFMFHESLATLTGFLLLFFCGFNLLEATLPSLISKTAPGDLKGTAMGAYSSAQFMGAFCGGTLGGWVYGEFGAGTVFLFCAFFACSWLIVSLFMKTPKYLANMLIPLDSIAEKDIKEFVSKLLQVKGVAEVKPHVKEAIAYLKVDNQQLDKNQLQHLILQWTSA